MLYCVLVFYLFPCCVLRALKTMLLMFRIVHSCLPLRFISVIGINVLYNKTHGNAWKIFWAIRHGAEVQIWVNFELKQISYIQLMNPLFFH